MLHLTAPFRLRAGLTAVLLVVAAVVVVGWSRPAAATNGPTFTGGQVAAPYSSGGRQPAIASNGTKALVVWAEQVNGIYGIYGRITSSDTTTIGNRLTIFQGAKDSLFPDVAWNGSSWLVVWQYFFSSTDPDIRGMIVGPAGGVGSFITVEGATSYQSNPAVAGRPNGEWAVVWEDQRNSATTLTDLYYRRVSSSGTISMFRFYRLSQDVEENRTSELDPDIAWYPNGESFEVVYEAQGQGRSKIRDIYFDDKTLTDELPLVDNPSSQKVSAPSIAIGGKGYLVVYEDDRGGSSGVDIAGIGQLGTAGYTDPFILSFESGDERAPTVAFNGNFLVAWQDRRIDAGGDIYGKRLKADLSRLDTHGFPIAGSGSKDETPVLSPGSGKQGTFTAAWGTTPSGEAGGVVAYGISYPAPK